MLPAPPLWQPMVSPNPDGGYICGCAVAVVIHSSRRNKSVLKYLKYIYKYV